MSQILERLRERKLVQWALAYLAGAWLVLQLADVLAEPLGLSIPARQALLVAAMVAVTVVGSNFTARRVASDSEESKSRSSRPWWRPAALQ